MNPRPTNTLAIVSLVCGIASWVAFPLLAAIAGIITGHMARNQIRETGEDGDALALIGMIAGYANLGLSCLVFGFFILLWAGILASVNL